MGRGKRSLVLGDINEIKRRKKKQFGLFYCLAFFPPFRNLFYYRVGKISFFLKYIKPYPLFFIQTNKLGQSPYVLNHPYCTILHARKIGDNFNFCHLTTIGQGKHGAHDSLPIIGNNVTLGANVTIIGDIKIGNNVVVGAGSVVVKDIPDNCVVAGNPAKVIKMIE